MAGGAAGIVAATNVFVRADGGLGWLLIHHGSCHPPTRAPVGAHQGAAAVGGRGRRRARGGWGRGAGGPAGGDRHRHEALEAGRRRRRSSVKKVLMVVGRC